jgi:hypothetical protein
MAVVEAKNQNRRALTVWFTVTVHGTVCGLRSQVAYALLQAEERSLGASALGWVVSGQSPMTFFKSFVEDSKKNPGQLHHAAPAFGFALTCGL